MKKFALAAIACIALLLISQPASAGFRGGFGRTGFSRGYGYSSFGYGNYSTFGYGGFGYSYAQPVVVAQPVTLSYAVPVYAAPVAVAPVAAAAYSPQPVAALANVTLAAATVNYLATVPYTQQVQFLNTFYGGRGTAIHGRYFHGNGRRR
jgi:hypothetical protein